MLPERIKWQPVFARSNEAFERPLLTCCKKGRLRVAQQVHCHVSDEHLSVLVLRWNLTSRPAGGPRIGQHPYDILGVDIGQADKPWLDVLLDAP